MNNMDVFALPANYDLERAKGTVSAKLEPSWIEQRKQGSATLSYIGGHVVIRLLNKAFNYQWSFEVVKEEIVPSLPKPAYSGYGNARKPIMETIVLADGKTTSQVQKLEPQAPVVKVLGRLTVPGLGVKEQYGSKVLIGGATEQESAFKSASTDALKKCASLFGIGLDLYGEVEGFENQAYQEYQQAPAPQVQQQVQQAPYQQPAPHQPVPQQQQQQPTQQQPQLPEYQTAAQAQDSGNLATQQQGGTVLTPQPSESSQEGPITAGPARQFAWPPAEVQKMIDLKDKLGVTDNAQLTPYVREFLNSQDVTIQNITPDNITAFNVFLNSKLA